MAEHEKETLFGYKAQPIKFRFVPFTPAAAAEISRPSQHNVIGIDEVATRSASSEIDSQTLSNVPKPHSGSTSSNSKYTEMTGTGDNVSPSEESTDQIEAYADHQGTVTQSEESTASTISGGVGVEASSIITLHNIAASPSALMLLSQVAVQSLITGKQDDPPSLLVDADESDSSNVLLVDENAASPVEQDGFRASTPPSPLNSSSYQKATIP